MTAPPLADSEDEIASLIATLHETERRLEELTGGEVDTVSTGSGQPFLLRRAQRELRDRELAQQAATSRRERMLTTTLSSLTDFAYIFDRAGRFLFANQPLLDLWGLTLDAAVGKDFFELGYAPDLALRLQQQVQKVFEEKKCVTDETTYTSRAGVTGHYEYIFSPAFGANGSVDFVVGSTRDITERRRSEDALRVSEQRFKALFEQAAVGVAQVDASTRRILQINRRFCGMLGRSHAELQQLSLAELTHPDDAVRDAEAFRRIRIGEGREFSLEKRYLKKDGSVLWVSLTVSAMWESGENPNFLIVIAQDVSERKKLEEQLHQAQKMDAIGTLAGGIAHDFNNILAAIIGYTELARMIPSDNPESAEYLKAVLQASTRASELVRQILTFSRQEQPERRLVQLQPVVAESIALLRSTIPSTIEFETSLATNAPTVLADPTQVHQILMNLGTNAWHAMKDRTGRMQIKLEQIFVDAAHAAIQPRLRTGAYARISVSDTGSGMDAETLRRVFEPFFTTKPVGEGTGLGLAVVHGIMDTHDGAVTVYSQVGEGTVFHLYFPAQAGEVREPAAREGPVPRGDGERVLVVDDEELLAKLCQKALGALGYQAEFTLKPADALEMVRASPERFALVLTDQTMPGMTGTTLASKLRQIRPELPIILMTGYGLSLTPERLDAAGISHLLLKPATIFSLGSGVHAALHPPASP
jgi:PAS domain S-box-containing protein